MLGGAFLQWALQPGLGETMRNVILLARILVPVPIGLYRVVQKRKDNRLQPGTPVVYGPASELTDLWQHLKMDYARLR